MPSTCVSGACALGNRMTHEILQFAMRIAFRGVLHRGASRVIHRYRYEYHASSSIFKDRVRLGQFGNRKIPKLSQTKSKRLGRARLLESEARLREKERDFSLVQNDPSAGSPTETLLRLLIPLAKLAQQVPAPREEAPSPGFASSAISISDGRCVQRAGT